MIEWTDAAEIYMNEVGQKGTLDRSNVVRDPSYFFQIFCVESSLKMITVEGISIEGRKIGQSFPEVRSNDRKFMAARVHRFDEFARNHFHPSDIRPESFRPE